MSKHKVLIVDDETIFRKGLMKMIAALGETWEVVGEAKDGFEAIELLEQLRPDVLLTDIRMPRMDGLQLQQMIREQMPELICIVISGYDEFMYVQQSLRLGVLDYLLKPIERDQLAQVMDKVKLALQQRSASRLAVQQTHEQMKIRQHVSEHLIASLLRGSVHENDLRLLRHIGVEFPHSYYTCLVIKLDKHSVDRNRYQRVDPSLFQLYIQQFAQEMLSRRLIAYCFVMSDTEVVGLANSRHIADDRIELLQAAESLRREMKTLTKLTVSIGVGRTVQGVRLISGSYNDAEIALLYRLIVGGDSVLDYEQVADRNVPAEYIKWTCGELERAIHEGDANKTENQIEAMIHTMCEQIAQPELIHQQLCKLVIQYYELAGEFNRISSWLGSRDIRTVLFEICSTSSKEELIEKCSQLFARLAQCIAAAREEGSGLDWIHKSLRFMEQHYHEPITLKDVADHVFLNPAYFSTLFKQKTGKSFVERLTEIRIDEAKKRLAYTNDKIAVIAEHTGFANLRHFNRVFKKETACSPKLYRDLVRRG